MRENDMTAMTAMTTMTDVFDDLRSAQDDLVGISRAHGLRLGTTATMRAWPPAVDIFERGAKAVAGKRLSDQTTNDHPGR